MSASHLVFFFAQLLRRKKDKTTKPNLLRFLRDTAPGPIAAVYVYLVTSSEPPERRTLVVDHLTLAGVEDLLNSPMSSTHGMLQKFVPPKSCYNNMVQTVFAHDTCHAAVRCSNPHMFVNGLIPLELRAMGADDKMYFLWPSLVVFENQEAIMPCQLVTPSRLEHLVMTAPPPLDVAAPRICLACGNPHRERSGAPGTSATFLVTFKAIVAAHRYTASMTQSPTQNQNNQNPTQNQNQTGLPVPGVIRASYGPISDDKFNTLVEESSFLYVVSIEHCDRTDNRTTEQIPNRASQSTRWRSWKDPRHLATAALGPKKPQSARQLFRKPELHVTPIAIVPASPATPSGRKSLAGPSLELVRRSYEISDNQKQHVPLALASDKVEFVSKPRPVSAASTLVPSRPRVSVRISREY
ncbi:hypothetical protein DYB36_002259 [Aphanomyces astaci]|uniref:Uncharacterized protein n=1 Tax=Aphanomyces astaci TaxID=112090 RepID=A0A397A3D4_APHAT|nr:hypothetical protein DYB36_002259 [Aphanomyces astaci]